MRITVISLGVTILGILVFAACDDPERQIRDEADRKWNGPCADESTLLATTAGSPNGIRCTNKHHRMRVQVATTPSHEEIGALVFCECERETDAGAQ